MLTEQLMKFLENQRSSKGKMELYQEERDYAIAKGLLNQEEVQVLDNAGRFEQAYLELGDKETENFLREETKDFLKQPINYFSANKNEFLYMESKWFDLISVDAISFELDDVFGLYDVMLGLRLPKKLAGAIKEYFHAHLTGPEAKLDVIFDANEGIWNVNFALNGLAGYREDMTIGEAYGLIYSFLFALNQSLES